MFVRVCVRVRVLCVLCVYYGLCVKGWMSDKVHLDKGAFVSASGGTNMQMAHIDDRR